MKILTLPILSLLIFLISCEAPRENPFDPKSSNYFDQKPNLITSKVTVKHLYPPFKPIPDIEVIEPNLQFFGITDSKGVIQFEHLPVDSLQFFVFGEPYFADTVRFANHPLHEYEIFLNARPQLNSVQMKSYYNNVYPGFNLTSLSFQANITDLDGQFDIKQVVLTTNEFDFDTLLNRDVNKDDLFFLEFNLLDISTELTPEQAPELNFNLIVKNNNDDQITAGPFSVKRVIVTELQQVSPKVSDVTKDSVVFRWEDPDLPFDYVFNIVLLKFPFTNETIYSGIPKGETSFTVRNLSPGQYNWKLQVEDKLGNICQSNYINFYHE